ncbi:MAG: TIGR03435 family protein [Acidobacteriota bacterium]
MNKLLSALLTAALLTAGTAAFAQTSPRPAFEVASVKPSPEVLQAGITAGVRIDGLQIRCASLALKDYIGMAYRMRLYQISGPDWLASARFDIVATMPAGSAIAQFPEMMQSLLEERFALKVSPAKKDFPTYALEIGKNGSKLKETPPDLDANPNAPPSVNVSGSGSRDGLAINLGNGASYTFTGNRLEAKKLNMQTAAGILERFLDRPVIDMTNLKSTYDFVIDVTQEDYRVMLIRAGLNAGVALPPEALHLLDGPAPGSLFDGIERLGLKLDGRKAPLDVLVIDSASKTPTEN